MLPLAVFFVTYTRGQAGAIWGEHLPAINKGENLACYVSGSCIFNDLPRLMDRLIARLILVILLALMAGPAAARCQGMVVLMGLHDNYLAVLNETRGTQARAAKAFLVTAGGTSPRNLARKVAETGRIIDEDRLSAVLDQGAKLASAVLLGPVRDPGFQHGLNVDWLAQQIRGSDCLNTFLASDRGPGPTPAMPPSSKVAKLVKEMTESELFLPLLLAGLVALSGAVVGAVVMFRRSLTFRRRKIARLPRTPLTLSIPITFTDGDGNMQQCVVDCVDMSVGGIKLRWNAPPPKGATVTASLSIGECLGTVVWSNLYYAGIAFETMLTKADVDAVEAAAAA